jgi:hypothetical protein
VGIYGEVGYRVGGTGLGSGITASQSLDYNFKHNGWSTTTSEGAYASFGPFNAGINFSQSYDISNKQWSNSWGVSAGIGIGNERGGIGLYAGYGSGGWSYGVGGYYNPFLKPYYFAELEDYENVPQSDKFNCKNATLESIEKMNGGTRTQADFKVEGEKFLKEFRIKYGREATLEEYFEHFGFDVRDPTIRLQTKYHYGEAIKNGNPIVVVENISPSLDHTMTIVKMKQWTPNGKMKVWFADPARGIRKVNWNIFYTPSFQRGQGLFLFNLR